MPTEMVAAWSAGNGPVGADGHVPPNGYTVPLSKCYGFMIVPSFLRLNTRLFADLPMHVCNCLVVAVDVFSLGQGSQRPDGQWPG